MPGKGILGWLEKHSANTLKIVSRVPRMRKVCALLGNPERKLKIVHVTGTNGKGSVTRMVASILEASGYRTGLYTSPHMMKINERIQVNGRSISDRDLSRLVLKVRNLSSRNGMELTFFELMTIVAILYYVEKKVDVAAIEVGRGGFTDATFVLDALVAVITPISLEHTEQLGSTTAKIAYQKSGIIKKGCTTVTAVRDKAALAVVRKRASAMNSRLIIVGRGIKAKRAGSNLFRQRFSLSGFVSVKNCIITLPGFYQVGNAATAAAAAYALNGYGFRIAASGIRKGLAAAFIPGRLEIIRRKPMIMLDIAHNMGAVATLSKAMRMFRKKVLLVFGISAGKKIPEMVRVFSGMADELIITAASYRGADTKYLESEVRKHHKKHSVIVPVSKAVTAAVKKAKGRTVLVTGSLFVVSEARKKLLRR